ncbi:MAG: ral secretion pathway protein [Verrucomicrobiota bacterium]|jgi:general secretion pathway protein K
MLALWALFLLSALIITWALDIDSRLRLSGSANRILEAEALACSGAEVALHPQIKPDSPNLNHRVPPRGSYEVRITGEGGRLNLNWLVAGEDPARLEILRKYLEIKHIDLNERDRMIDCLLDWVDPDDLVRLNGAEREGDYRPANTLLTRIDELKKVKGWEQFTSAPGWDDEFTLNSVGPVDLTWASRDVLLALPGMTESLVDRFLAMRRGPDGIDGTSDDVQFKGQEEIRAAFGFSEQQFQEIAGLVIFKDPSFRIVSVGKSGEATRTVQMVVRKTGAIPQLVLWKEL